MLVLVLGHRHRHLPMGNGGTCLGVDLRRAIICCRKLSLRRLAAADACFVLVQMAWEKLHTGNWKDVSLVGASPPHPPCSCFDFHLYKRHCLNLLWGLRHHQSPHHDVGEVSSSLRTH